MTKKHHKCDETCKGHEKKKKKRVMGTTKKPAHTESIPDDVMTGTVTINGATNTTDSGTFTELEPQNQTWVNIAEAAITKTVNSGRNEKFVEAEQLLDSINQSGNVDAIEEAKFIVEECQRKLFNLKRDKEIDL